jgi:LacI family transcriptional regulator
MSRAPNMQQVADAAGVSKSAVSLALRDDPRLAAETRRRVQQIAEQMGYRKNPIVASLMSQLRASQTPRFQANFALINCSPNRQLFDVPAFAEFRRGIRERADQNGYGVEEFWADEPGVPLGRLRQILHARSIKGVLVATAREARPLFLGHTEFFHEFCFASVGAERTDPPLPRAANNFFRTARAAVDAAFRLGYRRPGLMIDERLDTLLERRLSSGFAAAIQDRASQFAGAPTVPLVSSSIDAIEFARWLKSEKPDVVITEQSAAMDWARTLKIAVPDELGLIHLEWNAQLRDWAGLNQNSALVGAAAADLLIGQLVNNETGIPDHPKLVVIDSDFVGGPSVREVIAADAAAVVAPVKRRMPLRALTSRVLPGARR